MVKESTRYAGAVLNLLIALSLTLSSVTMAGEGKFSPPTWNNKAAYDISKSGRLDLHVFLDHDLSDANWSEAKLKEYFGRISYELWDATERQVQLGKVRIYRAKPGAEKKSDIIVSKTIPGAYTSANNFGKDGVLGKIYSPPNDIWSGATRPTIIHELGHLLFGIYDSYVGWLKGTLIGAYDLQPNAAKDGWEWKTADYRWYNNNLPMLPEYGYPEINSPVWKNIFYDNTEFNDDSVCCIMDGPHSGEREFSTPVDAATIWNTEHLPIRKKVHIKWSSAPDKSVLNPPFETDVDIVTEQNKKNNEESAWETIVRNHTAMAIPITVPVANSRDLAAFVEFDDLADDDVKLILVPDVNQISVVIDRSSSMFNEPMAQAQRAANLMVDLSHQKETVTINGNALNVAGDYLSVASFSTDATVNYSSGGKVAEMTADNKTAAKNAVSLITAGGNTSIGGGLQAGLGTINQDDTPKNIILLSDGDENTSPHISSVENDLLNNEVRVFSAALGSGAHNAKLRDLSNKTGGKYFHSMSAAQLPGIFAQIYTLMTDESSVRIQGGEANANANRIASNIDSDIPIPGDQRKIISPITRLDLRPEDRDQAAENNFRISSSDGLIYENVVIDDSVSEATFVVTGEGSVILVNPLDQIISGSVTPDISYTYDSGVTIYRIKNIMSGTWQVRMAFYDLDVQWELRVSVIDDQVECYSQTVKNEYVFGEDIVIQASCNAPQPVIEGQAWAVVVGPLGRETHTVLYDDGDINHGDEYAGDGIYSTIYSPTDGNGDYNVTSVFDSTDATTPDGSSEGMQVSSGTILTPEPVPVFQRYNQFTFYLRGFPYGAGDLDTDGDGMPDLWEDVFGLDATDPSDAALDPDNDKLKNLDEFLKGTNPLFADTDGDSHSDYDELLKESDPLDSNSVPIIIARFPWSMFMPAIKYHSNIDYDSDGYTIDQGDCNDSNPAVHPGRTEICGDAVDQNCNGSYTDCAPPASAEDRLLELINIERYEVGRPTLVRSPGLDRIINWHVSNMAADKFLNHTDKNGRDGEGRVRYYSGDSSVRCVELIQWWGGIPPSGDVHYAHYKESPGHHSGYLEEGINNLGPTTHVGVSIHAGTGPIGTPYETRDGSYSGVLLCDQSPNLVIDPFAEK